MEVLSSSLKVQTGEAGFPMRCLGIPLLSKHLSATNCIPLVDAITNKVTNWTSRRLSYADRIQPVSAVLFALQN
ncbi:hypothetical protein MLD38_038270 [Melastoma candidum]|uniref:Uncharacterized protein n=1 Tax=Melastoma candidum TaxID=119954 RepID=A0ACB9KYC7_9MYRT|nr:hypothetical protein MLD38_038270 [Melastoma candidum]